MLPSRSDASSPSLSSKTKQSPANLPNQSTNPSLPSSSSSSSFISSPPSTPRRSSLFISYTHPSTPAAGFLTPVSSRASLSPALHTYKDSHHPPPPTFSLNAGRRSTPQSPRRRSILPAQPTLSLELHTKPVQYSAALMMTTSSRPSSPSRRSRALSPTRPDIPRPPSRCESLLRDTLRRADEQERVRSHRSGSRSPGRWAGTKRARPHGNPFMGALRPEDQGDSDCDCDDLLFAYSPNERDNYNYPRRRSVVGNAPRVVRGANYSSPTEAVSYPYGSPSSPSPMPPLMSRTHTAPAVPRPLMQRTRTSEHRDASTRLSPSPRADRRSLPNTVIQSHAHSNVASGESSPKQQRTHTLSPHESVLRAKLEYVLQKAGPSQTDEAEGQPRAVGRVRKHQRAFSHGVTVNTSSRQRDDPSSASPSPQSLAASSLSNSASDLARAYSSPSYGGDSTGQGSSPSPPSEPLTPPPTPPFNARTALEMCKRMEGYVSFASVEGLGEPPGMDIDSDDSEENLRLWARWWRKWSFSNGANGAAIHGLAGLTVGRHRSDSASSR